MFSRSKSLILIGALIAGGVGFATADDQPAAPLPDGLQQQAVVAQKLRRSGGPPEVVSHNRYRKLLATIAVPNDQASYGDFCDYGYWEGKSYAGHDDLPVGYWVYLAPNWYIYKESEMATAVLARGPRSWGPEQATGAPDTWPNAGDIPTAWASATPDGQPEWLELTYDGPTRPVAVTVYETFNPGAVNRVTGYDANGKEVELWSGADPTPAGKEKGISVIPVHPDFDLTRVRVYVDSPKVAGWNEIDAVGLLDAAGTTHWAVSATASSSYADLAPLAPGARDVDRLEQLEDRSSGPKSTRFYNADIDKFEPQSYERRK